MVKMRHFPPNLSCVVQKKRSISELHSDVQKCEASLIPKYKSSTAATSNRMPTNAFQTKQKKRKVTLSYALGPQLARSRLPLSLSNRVDE